MTTWQTFIAGFDPDHMPAFIAGLLYAIAVPLYGWLRPRVHTVPAADRLAGHLLIDSAVIHAALPIGHHDDPVLTILFVGSGVVYGVLGWRAVAGGRYRIPSALLIAATLIAYVRVVGTGGEGADQVGILTAVLEVVTLGICLVPRSPAPVRRTFGSVTFVLAIMVTGGSIWAASFAGHSADGGSGPAAGHHHDADRGQAGMIMAPLDDQDPTPEQVRAAATLAAETKLSLDRYTDVRVAIAAGYTASLQDTGLRVHLENKAYGKDGRILDPEHPEMLMYAIADGRATLLGAVFQMPRAGLPGPTPGGPITQWHAHDVCLTAMPPSYTVVNAYGTCPMFSVHLTVGEMMHVWTVDHPGGPYDDDSPDSWIRAYNLAHGEPFTWSGQRG
jgi:hypothetical protein